MTAIEICKSENGSSMLVMMGFIILLLALGGLIIEGGNALTTYTQLDMTSEMAVVCDLGAFDREIWIKERRVFLDRVVAEEAIRDNFNFNMPQGDIVCIEPKSENTTYLRVKCDVPLYFMKALGYDEDLTFYADTETYIID